MEKMNMRKWLFFPCLAFVLGTEAQTLRVKGNCVTGDAAALSLYVNAMGVSAPEGTVKLTADKDKFEGEVSAAPGGFYNLYGNDGGRQMVVPFYFPDASKTCKLKLQMKDGCPLIDGSKDNKALSAFNELVYVRGRYFWSHGKDMDKDGVSRFLRSYGVSADSLVRRYGCAEPVRQYLDLWAYLTAYNNYEGWAAQCAHDGAEVTLKLTDVLEEPYKVLDTPMASYFPAVSYLIFQTLPAKGTFEDKLAYLEEHYKCADIRKTVGGNLVDGFIRSFDFSGDFEAGLARLRQAVEKCGLDGSYVENFKKRKSSAKGKAFPAGAVITDAEGNKVDISSFKGRYVYIDLWASWCGPCVKEVPFLQKLEKEIENKDIVFVSISLDKNEEAWRAKMKALNMHGNQWLNQDNSLAEALNVKGIPYFVIYDKEGRLYMSNAPRPSHPALKEMLEGLH